MVVPSVKYILHPWTRLDHGAFDLASFSEDVYEWEPDPWWGLYDIAQPVDMTLSKGAGDCVDYARLAVAWLVHNTDRPVVLYVCIRRNWPPAHLIAYDGERTYSNGNIVEETVPEYLDRTGRWMAFRRCVRGCVGPAITRSGVSG